MGAHLPSIRTLIRRGDEGEERGWAARPAQHLRCSPQLRCPAGVSLPRDDSSPALQTGGAAPLIAQFLEQAQGLLVEGMCGLQVPLHSGDLPQEIEWMREVLTLPQRPDEGQA